MRRRVRRERIKVMRRRRSNVFFTLSISDMSAHLNDDGEWWLPSYPFLQFSDNDCLDGRIMEREWTLIILLMARWCHMSPPSPPCYLSSWRGGGVELTEGSPSLINILLSYLFSSDELSKDGEVEYTVDEPSTQGRCPPQKTGFFGNFSQRGGGGLFKSQNFCKFTKCFFVCQNHS